MEEDYRDDMDVFYSVLEIAVKSLDEAAREGVLLRNGQRVYLVPVGHKGDWSYLEPLYCITIRFS